MTKLSARSGAPVLWLALSAMLALAGCNRPNPPEASPPPPVERTPEPAPTVPPSQPASPASPASGM